MKRSRGVTLLEVMVVVALLGGLSLVAAAGSRMFNFLQREMQRVTIERDTQIAMQQILTDIQNAKNILDIGPDHITLRTYDFKRLGFDVNQTTITGTDGTGYHLFDEVAMGTVTYMFVASNAVSSDRYVLCSSTFGDGPVPLRCVRSRMSVNQLFPPDAQHPIFSPNPNDLTAKASTDSVRVTFSVNSGYFKNAPEVYTEDVALRAAGGNL